MTVQATIASMGLPAHAPLRTIEDDLEDTLRAIRTNGPKAKELATQLAANGYPASTLGDGGSRATDPTSSTERAAARAMDYTDQFANADRALAQALAEHHRTGKRLTTLIANIVHHATDIDPVPVGTGYCQACGRFCRPDKAKPGNRLRSALCPTDYRAWLRAGQPHHNDWIRTRRDGWTDDNGVLHTPEPDHDLDLTSENLSPDAM